MNETTILLNTDRNFKFFEISKFANITFHRLPNRAASLSTLVPTRLLENVNIVALTSGVQYH